MLEKKIGRRQFIHLSAVGTAGVILGACAPQVTPTAQEQQEQPEQPAATEAPAAEPTATQKPAEPVKEATPTEAPQVTSKYIESPVFAQMVADGTLPPVDERLPTEPRILTSESIGQYSERLNLLTTGTFGDFGHEMFQGMFGELNDSNLFADFARGFEMSEDGTTFTIHIRKGLKWSDGEPVTTEDVRFWHEDDATFTEISPSTPGFGYTLAGEFCSLEIVDDYTFKLIWSKPNPTFPYTLRYWASMWWCSFTGTPSHYLKQFHIKYNENVEEEATAAGFDTWVAYYGARKSPTNATYGPEKPSLNSWLLKESTQTHQVYVPSPYYWGIDQEGQQLPYFQEVLEVIVADQESYNLKIVAGEADYAAFFTKLKDMPLFVDSADSGGYRVFRYKSPRGSDESFSFNFTIKDPVLSALFQDPRWNQAMSYAINRAEVQDVVFLGTGVPRQAAPNPEVSFFKPEWETHCANYDPDMANALLDELGLTERDADGFRKRSDGQTLNILLEYTTNIDSPAQDVIALVVQHWRAVGVKVDYKEIERELLFTRGSTNELQMGVWHTDRTNESRLYVPAAGKLVADGIYGENPSTNEWYRWHSSNGEEGIEPPDDWKQHLADIDAWHSATTTEEYQRLGTKIFDFAILEKLRVIGTVGFSAWPVIVKNDIGNIPETGYMGDDTGFARSLFTSTWYRV